MTAFEQRCDGCNQLLFWVKNGSVEIKCPRCNRMVLLPLNLLGRGALVGLRDEVQALLRALGEPEDEEAGGGVF